RNAVLELKDGEIHEVPAEEDGARRYRRMVFKTHVIYVQGAGGFLERTVRTSRSDRELSARDLAAERAQVETQYHETLVRHRARPGMRVRRAGPAVAFVSIGFFLFYYLCLVGGEELANRLMLPAWLAMWLPNLVLGGWGLAATLRATDVLSGLTASLPRLAPAPGA